MTTKLNTVDEVQAGDSVVIYSGQDADFVRAALSVMLAYYQANLTFPDTGKEEDTIQSIVPLTGASVQLTDGDANIWAIIQPAGTIATLTLVLPALANLRDKQEILFNFTNIVTDLTLSGNGASIVGGPTTIAVENVYFKLKYYAFNTTWYRVG